MGKLGNIWKTVLAGGAGVAALAALNAAIIRRAATNIIFLIIQLL